MIPKSTSGGMFCILGVNTLVSLSWMCKKQTASHSGAASEIILLGANGCYARSAVFGMCFVQHVNNTHRGGQPHASRRRKTRNLRR